MFLLVFARGSIIPGFLRWCEMDFAHPQYHKGAQGVVCASPPSRTLRTLETPEGATLLSNIGVARLRQRKKKKATEAGPEAKAKSAWADCICHLWEGPLLSLKQAEGCC